MNLREFKKITGEEISSLTLKEAKDLASEMVTKVNKAVVRAEKAMKTQEDIYGYKYFDIRESEILQNYKDNKFHYNENMNLNQIRHLLKDMKDITERKSMSPAKIRKMYEEAEGIISVDIDPKTFWDAVDKFREDVGNSLELWSSEEYINFARQAFMKSFEKGGSTKKGHISRRMKKLSGYTDLEKQIKETENRYRKSFFGDFII